MNKPLCIYHSHCLDGYTAAWVVRKYFNSLPEPVEVEFVPGVYGQNPPDVHDRDVVIVDFSYSRELVLRMAGDAKSVTIIDHHKTAIEALSDITTSPSFGAVLDATRSGCRLAWDYFFPWQEAPDIVRFVEDRDLWRFRYPETRAYCQWLGSFDMDFDRWDHAAEGGIETSAIIVLGEELLRQYRRQLRVLVQMGRRYMTIGGSVVPVANVPVMFSSDAGNELAQGAAFAATYTDTINGRQFSLRSLSDGADVSVIAKLYGGGGHRNAAGFKVPRSHELAQA